MSDKPHFMDDLLQRDDVIVEVKLTYPDKTWLKIIGNGSRVSKLVKLMGESKGD